jgi:hypothetical protein
LDRRKLPLSFAALVGVVFLCSCGTQSPLPLSSNGFAEYFGLEKPGLSPMLFAPGILPPEGAIMHSSPTFSPDGTEVYFSAYFPDEASRIDAIMFLEWAGGSWSAGQVAAFSGEYNDNWPWFAPDGNRIYFSSNRPQEGGGETTEEYGLWYVERREGGWSSPRQVVSPADFGRDEGPIYVAAILPGGYGDMDIYQLEYVEGTYSMPENLGPAVNTNAEEYGPCVAPDGSYLVFARFEDERERGVGLYVSFWQGDGAWSEAQRMGSSVEAFRDGRFPGLSPDGEYLFYVAEGGDIYWVDTGVVEQFRPGE